LRALLAIGAGAFIVPLLLITGSRAGLLLGLTALVLSGAILATGQRGSGPRNTSSHSSASDVRAKPKGRRMGIPALIGVLLAGAACLVAITVALSRDLAVERLLERDIAEDARAKTMPTILEITQQHVLLGSGFGSFEQVYQVHEPDALLGPTYMNHAHNDWLELVQTGGFPALALLLAGIVWAALRIGKYSWSNAVPGDFRRLGQVGACFLFLAGMASIGDYPLRTPSLASLTVIALVWIGMMTPARAESRPV
jgi:O-antigen ligase